MANKYTVTKKIDELEKNINKKINSLKQRYNNFKKDLIIFLIFKFLTIYFFIMHIMVDSKLAHKITLILLVIFIVLEYGMALVIALKYIVVRILFKNRR